MLDAKLLEPLKMGHLMISPRVKIQQKNYVSSWLKYVAKNKKTESIITAQIKIKIILYNLFLKCGRAL